MVELDVNEYFRLKDDSGIYSFTGKYLGIMSSQEESESSVMSSMRSLTGGASIFVTAKGISHIAGFLINLVLTRTLGAHLYGIYSYLNVISGFVLKISNLGSDNSILKFVPYYEDDQYQRSAMVILAYITSLAASVTIALGLYVFAPLINTITLNDPIFVDVLRIFAFIIPFNTLRNLIAAMFKSYEDMFSSVLIKKIVSPISRLGAVLVALGLGYSLYGIIAATVVAAGLTALFGLWLIHRQLDDDLIPVNPSKKATEFYNFTLPLLISDVGSVFYKKIDLLMVGVFLASSAVGVYNIAALLATFLALPMTAFNQLFPPIASKLYSRNKMSDLNKIYAITNRWILTLTLFPFLSLVAFTDRILLIFGPEFVSGATVLLFLSTAQLISSTVGPSGYVLMMTDHQYMTMINNGSSAILNVILNYYFILQFGFIGAAVATSLVVTLVNLAKLVEVWYFEGLFPFNRQYYKPLFAGLISGISMSFIGSISQAHFFIVLSIGGGVGALLYGGVLYLLGFEDAERELFSEVVGQ